MPFSDNRKNLYQQLHKLIKIIEELYREGEFSGSPEAVFDLIERCTFERPPESVVALIDYRIMVSFFFIANVIYNIYNISRFAILRIFLNFKF